MRTTINFDDDLVAKAQTYTGLREKSALVQEALRALIERESARRLVRLGGTETKIKAIKKNPPPFIQPDPFSYQSIMAYPRGRSVLN